MKKLVSMLLLAAMVLMLTACSGGNLGQMLAQYQEKAQEQMDDEQVREMVLQLVDAAIEEDYETVSALLNRDYISDEDVDDMYPILVQLVAGMEVYELMSTYKSVHTVNGVTTVGIQYLLEAEDRVLVVEASRMDGEPGLVGIGMWEYVPETQTGTLTTMKGANAAQWILLAVGILEMAFVLWMFIDCCCHKMKKKWAWLLITGLGAVAVTLSVQSSGIHMNFNVGFFFNIYTALILHSNGGFALRTMVPVGAVVYAIIRKHLFQVYEASLQPPVVPQWDPAQMPAAPTWNPVQTPAPPAPEVQTVTQPESEPAAEETPADEA